MGLAVSIVFGYMGKGPPGNIRSWTDINGHLEKFTCIGKYCLPRFSIVNFAMDPMDRKTCPALPSDARYHDRVFTYVHSTNTLYRGTGNKVLCRPVCCFFITLFYGTTL